MERLDFVILRQTYMLNERVIPNMNENINARENDLEDVKRVQRYRMKLLAQQAKGILKCAADKQDTGNKILECHPDCLFDCPKIDPKLIDQSSISNIEDKPTLSAKIKPSSEEGVDKENIYGCPMACIKTYEKMAGAMFNPEDHKEESSRSILPDPVVPPEPSVPLIIYDPRRDPLAPKCKPCRDLKEETERKKLLRERAESGNLETEAEELDKQNIHDAIDEWYKQESEKFKKKSSEVKQVLCSTTSPIKEIFPCPRCMRKNVICHAVSVNMDSSNRSNLNFSPGNTRSKSCGEFDTAKVTRSLNTMSPKELLRHNSDPKLSINSLQMRTMKSQPNYNLYGSNTLHFPSNTVESRRYIDMQVETGIKTQSSIYSLAVKHTKLSENNPPIQSSQVVFKPSNHLKEEPLATEAENNLICTSEENEPILISQATSTTQKMTPCPNCHIVCPKVNHAAPCPHCHNSFSKVKQKMLSKTTSAIKNLLPHVCPNCNVVCTNTSNIQKIQPIYQSVTTSMNDVTLSCNLVAKKIEDKVSKNRKITLLIKGLPVNSKNYTTSKISSIVHPNQSKPKKHIRIDIKKKPSDIITKGQLRHEEKDDKNKHATVSPKPSLSHKRDTTKQEDNSEMLNKLQRTPKKGNIYCPVPPGPPPKATQTPKTSIITIDLKSKPKTSTASMNNLLTSSNNMSIQNTMEEKTDIDLDDFTIDNKGRVVLREPKDFLKKQRAKVISIKDVLDEGETEFRKVQRLRESLNISSTKSMFFTRKHMKQKATVLAAAKAISEPYTNEQSSFQYTSTPSCNSITENDKNKDFEEQLFNLTKTRPESKVKDIQKKKSERLFKEDEHFEIDLNESKESLEHPIGLSLGTLDLPRFAGLSTRDYKDNIFEEKVEELHVVLNDAPVDTRITEDEEILEESVMVADFEDEKLRFYRKLIENQKIMKFMRMLKASMEKMRYVIKKRDSKKETMENFHVSGCGLNF